MNVNSAFLWNYEVHVTINHLRQKLEGLSANEKRKTSVFTNLTNGRNALEAQLPYCSTKDLCNSVESKPTTDRICEFLLQNCG